jgi:hypothetical protein
VLSMTIVGPVGTGSGRAAAATPGASGRSAVAAGCADCADCPAAVADCPAAGGADCPVGCADCAAEGVADCAAVGCADCAWAAAGKPPIAKASAAVSARGRAITARGSAKRKLRRVTPMREIPVDATEHRLTHNRQQRQPWRERSGCPILRFFLAKGGSTANHSRPASSFWRSQNLRRCPSGAPSIALLFHAMGGVLAVRREQGPVSFACHSRRESASFFDSVCSCCHPERVFRARRIPTNPN